MLTIPLALAISSSLLAQELNTSNDVHIPLPRTEVENNPELIERYRALRDIGVDTRQPGVMQDVGNFTRIKATQVKTRGLSTALLKGKKPEQADRELEKLIRQLFKAAGREFDTKTCDFRVTGFHQNGSVLEVRFDQYVNGHQVSAANELQFAEHDEFDGADGATVNAIFATIVDVTDPFLGLLPGCGSRVRSVRHRLHQRPNRRRVWQRPDASTQQDEVSKDLPPITLIQFSPPP